MVLVSFYANAQFSPNASKTQWANGVSIGTKSGFNYPDSNVIYWRYDSTLMAKYKGTPIVLGGTGAITNNFVTPEQYGAVGDGSTNDYTALQNAINSGKVVFLGRKVYKTNTSLTLPSGAMIFGSGDSSIIKTSSSIDVLSATNKTNIVLKDFRIKGSIGTSKGVMINGATFDATFIDNVYFDSLYQGFYYTGGYLTHSGIRVSNCIARYNTYGFYNDAYGEYTTYSNCAAEYNTTGWYSIAGNDTWTGGSLVNNTYAGIWMKYGANGGHGAVTGATINHNGNYAIILDSVPTSFLFSNCNVFYGDTVLIKNSPNVSFESVLFSRQLALLMGGSNNVLFNNPIFITTPTTINTSYGTASTVRWFNPIFYDKTTPPVGSKVSTDLQVQGAIRITGKDSSNLRGGIEFSTNNIGIEDTWVGGRIRLENITGFGADMNFYTHPANSTNDTLATKKFVISESGAIYTSKLYDQSATTSDSILVKNTSLGQLKLIPQSRFTKVSDTSSMLSPYARTSNLPSYTQYWQRVSTNLSPATAGDGIRVPDVTNSFVTLIGSSSIQTGVNGGDYSFMGSTSLGLYQSAPNKQYDIKGRNLSANRTIYFQNKDYTVADSSTLAPIAAGTLTLTTASQPNITGVGALTSGSIGSGFGGATFGGRTNVSSGYGLFVNGGTDFLTPSASRGVVEVNGTTDAYFVVKGNGVTGYFGVDATFGNLYVTSPTTRIFSNGSVGLSMSSTQVITLSSLGTGTVQATAGVLSVISDSRMKDKKGSIKNATDLIMRIPKPEYWSYNKKSGLPTQVKKFGLYADSVHYAIGEQFAPTQKDGVYGLDDNALLGLAIQSIQELKKEIEELKKRIK